MVREVPKEPLLVVLGATGTGKSQLAVDLARRFNGEVINGDAVQMYDGMPIITNKITVAEQQGVPHHLLGFIGLDQEPWRVGLFKQKASQIIEDIRSRGRIPILVGGTHYYTQSLLFDESLVAEPSEVEAEMPTELSNNQVAKRFPILESSTEEMLDSLRQIDPIMADRWHPKERRKIRRSLEIFLLTGRKASDVYAEQRLKKELVRATADEGSASSNMVRSGSTLLLWVHAESEILKERLNNRVNKMMEAGLLKEVESMSEYLHKKSQMGLPIDRTRGIWVSIGWKEFEPYLEALESAGISTQKRQAIYDECVNKTKAATRQYAKRQIRWIRLQLMTALSNVGALNKLYLLDGSDVSVFPESVSNTAINITAKFLAGEELPLPHDISDAAKQVLGTDCEAPEKPDVWYRQTCDTCHITAVTDLQWQIHLKSRRHRGLMKKLAKRGSGSQAVDLSKNEVPLVAP